MRQWIRVRKSNGISRINLLSYFPMVGKCPGASRKKPPSSPHLCQPVGYRRVIGCAQKVISRVQKIFLGNTSMNIWSRAPWAPERGIQIRRRDGNIKVGESWILDSHFGVEFAGSWAESESHPGVGAWSPRALCQRGCAEGSSTASRNSGIVPEAIAIATFSLLVGGKRHRFPILFERVDGAAE